MRILKLILLVILINVYIFIPELNARENPVRNNNAIKILTSFYPMYIMALNVVKDVPGVTVENLTPPVTGCLHDYALTARDMKKIADADILIANGAQMESFFDQIIARYPRLKIVTLAEGVDFIKDNGEANPHVWVSVANAVTQVKNLGRALATFDPAHAELYRNNTSEYVDKLETLRQMMRSELAPYKGRKIVTFHEAFPYFAQEFGLEVAAVIERDPGSEPNAKELARTIDIVNKSGINALFSEPQYPAQSAEAIARETDAKFYILDPAVTGPADFDAYIDIMENNLAVLKEAFQSNPKAERE